MMVDSPDAFVNRVAIAEAIAEVRIPAFIASPKPSIPAA
jgi:hypothetical protein